MWEQLKRVIKPRGAIVLFGSQPFTSALVMSNPGMFKYQWIWGKKLSGNPLLAQSQPMKTHEDICVFSTGAHNYYPIMVAGEARTSGGGYSNLFSKDMGKVSIRNERFPKSIVEFYSGRINKLHPTQKPLALLEYLVKTYTNEQDTVLDFTFGSGTTGAACVNLDRDFIGIERDENYFNLASDRINKALTTPRQQSILDV